jgi:hypothetical protein
MWLAGLLGHLLRLRIHDFINTQISLYAEPQQIARICTGRSVRN